MRALMGLRAESLDEFLHYSREELLAVNGVGAKTVTAIEESLRQRGLALHGEFS
jgi:DNA-directed RNA polymerase alpha subunit